MIEDKLKTVELARQLFVARLTSYWGNIEQITPEAAIQGGKWRDTIGADTASKWYHECLEMARTAVSQELEYLNK